MRCAIRFVLVEPSHPGNIGATARAMRNMQFTDLSLVRPKCFPHAAATARAAGADGILQNATIHDTLAQALRGCTLVYGASARPRNIAWPTEDPRECATHIATLDDPASVAIVLGRERTGLSNDELDLCHKMLQIPCNPDFPSLNLAAAAQIITYELLMATPDIAASGGALHHPDNERAATQEEMAHFYHHLEQIMLRTAFLDPDNPRQLRRRLRRLFNRTAPSATELNILRGIFTAVEKHLTRTPHGGKTFQTAATAQDTLPQPSDTHRKPSC